MASNQQDASIARQTDGRSENVDNASVMVDATTDMSDTEKGNVTVSPGPQGAVRNIHGFKWVLVVVSILSSTFLFALDNTVVADVQPQIVLQFDAIGQIAWLSVAFIMGALSLTLLFGQLYSQLLPKWLYIASVVVFEVGSAVCGAAPNMDAMIVGRALCGLGGIGMYLGVMTLLASTTTIQERPIYIAGIGLTWALGTILGPIVGGAFADSPATWRWAFYINLVIGALAGPVYLSMLPSPDPRPGASLKARLIEVDFIGSVLLIGAIVCFTMAINFGGVLYDWSSGSEIALFVVAGVLFIVFGLQQGFTVGVTRSRRLFPVDLITSPKSARTVVIMFMVTAAGGCGIFVPVYFIPLFFQFTRGDSAVAAAVRLLPFILVMAVVTLTQGAVLSHPSGRYGLYMPWFLVGGCLTVAGSVLMYLVDRTTTDSWVYGASAFTGAGVGMFTQAGFSIAQASVSDEQHAMAAAFIALGQTGGITISLAIANAVFINRAQDSLRRILPPSIGEEQIEAAVAGVGGDFVKKLSPELQVRALDAIVEAMSRPYILVIVAGALVTVLSLIMKRERLFLAVTAPGA